MTSSVNNIVNVLKKYFGYSFVLVDFFFDATFDIKTTTKKRQKSDKHFKLVSPKSIVRVLYMRFELPLTRNTPPPPTIFLMAPMINMW